MKRLQPWPPLKGIALGIDKKAINQLEMHTDAQFGPIFSQQG